MVRFPPITQPKLMSDIPKTKITKLEQIADKAEQLWVVCQNDGCDELPDPTNWLYNQDSMRTMWENSKESQTNNNNAFMNLILNNSNSYSQYMDFMYNNYPAGFGNEIRKCYKEKKICDGENIYNKLSTKV